MKGTRFKIAKKMVVQVRYYEQMYFITDTSGIRVYTGNDEKKAREILAALNGYYARKKSRRGKIPLKRKRK